MSGDGLGSDGGLRDIGESAIEGLLERVGRGVSKVQERRPLAYDLLESEDAYLVVFDAPGTTNSDIQVQFREDAVEVKVDRFREFHEEFEMRFPGRGLSLDGTAELPEGASVDPTDAEATLAENGTLRVRIPKDEDDGPVDVAEESEADTDDTDDGPESIELDEHDGDGDDHSGETGDDEETEDHGTDADDHEDHGADDHDADDHDPDDHDANADDHEDHDPDDHDADDN
jgi:HSP20 family molecular chaperone IbpA